jgi:hypothetical protein
MVHTGTPGWLVFGTITLMAAMTTQALLHSTHAARPRVLSS